MHRLLFLALLLTAPFAFADDYQYAPRPKPVQGNRQLTCVGVKYEAEPGSAVSASKCKSVANQTKIFYERASRGLLKFDTKGGQVSVPGKKNSANYKKAVDKAKAQYPGADFWQVIGNPGTSHAGGKVAYLKGTLYRDAQHETGHLLGLGHAGRYVKDGSKWVLEAYGDGQSVMGRFPSSTLTAPQYYSRGWLLEKEAAMYVPGQVYEIKKVDNFSKTMLALVIVDPKYFKPDAAAQPVEELAAELDFDADLVPVAAESDNQRKAYVSYPPNGTCEKDPCLSIHLAIANGGGTQKVATFGQEYTDERFTGMHVKVLSKTSDSVKFTIDFPVVKK